MCTEQVLRSKASASQYMPHSSAPMHSLRTISMQMDAYFEKEQIGTLFVLRGAIFWGRGGVSFWASLPEFGHDVHYFFFYPPDGWHK